MLLLVAAAACVGAVAAPAIARLPGVEGVVVGSSHAHRIERYDEPVGQSNARIMGECTGHDMVHTPSGHAAHGMHSTRDAALRGDYVVGQSQRSSLTDTHQLRATRDATPGGPEGVMGWALRVVVTILAVASAACMERGRLAWMSVQAAALALPSHGAIIAVTLLRQLAVGVVVVCRCLDQTRQRWPGVHALVVICLVGAAACSPIGDLTSVSTGETYMREACRRVALLPSVQFHYTGHDVAEGGDRLFGCASSVMPMEETREGWETALIDCGASCMYFTHTEWFPHGMSSAPSNAVVHTANAMLVPQGIGTAVARVRAREGETVISFQRSLYMPSFTKNLVSVGKLIECSGAEVCFAASEHGCYVRHRDGGVIPFLRGTEKRGYVYHLPMSPVKRGGGRQNDAVDGRAVDQYACVAMRGRDVRRTNVSDAHILHSSFGHVGGRRIANLHAVTRSVPKVSARGCSDCEVCLEANAKQLHSDAAAPAPEEWGHFNVDFCGPLPPTYFEGFKYMFVANELSSGYKIVFGAKERAEAPQLYARLEAEVRALPGKRIVKLTSDNAGEFASKGVQQWCDTNSIVQRFGRAYEHNSNATGERAVRTIQEMARAMLLESGLPSSFWFYAAEYAAYVYNMLPNARVGMLSSPFMVAHDGEKPDGGNVKPFGCLVIAHKHGPEVGRQSD